MYLNFKKDIAPFLLLFSVKIYAFHAAITKEEFNLSVTTNGYPTPREDIFPLFAENTGNFSREEIAMLIAQLIHESGGFQFTEQLACREGDQCQGKYDDGIGLRNKTYYGRGFIQLTWAANYKVASEALGMKDKLLKYPELVANDTRINVLVSVWYWQTRVRTLLKGKEDMFGLTTKGINPEECIRVNRLAKRRYAIYVKVADVLKIENKAKENGCYN